MIINVNISSSLPVLLLSGGCGRTGTYIAICLLIDRLKTEGVVDVFQTVRGLRLQRPGMIRSVVSKTRREKWGRGISIHYTCVCGHSLTVEI